MYSANYGFGNAAPNFNNTGTQHAGAGQQAMFSQQSQQPQPQQQQQQQQHLQQQQQPHQGGQQQPQQPQAGQQQQQFAGMNSQGQFHQGANAQMMAGGHPGMMQNAGMQGMAPNGQRK